jgi:hypothetical protein
MADPTAWDVLPVISRAELADIGRAISARSGGSSVPPRRCMFCGRPAGFALAATTLTPPRWFDVCGAGGLYLRSGGPLCTGRMARHG